MKLKIKDNLQPVQYTNYTLQGVFLVLIIFVWLSTQLNQTGERESLCQFLVHRLFTSQIMKHIYV